MPAKCDNTLPGTDSRVIGQYLLQSVRGPLPLYRVIILPSCQSAGTMPDLHTWINRTYYKFIRSVQTRTHPFNGPFAGTTRVGQYQKGKTNLDFTGWAICKSAPCSGEITTPAPHHSVFLKAGCPSCRPTNSIKALN